MTGKPKALGGFIDALLQTFEDCRVGLPDDVVRGDPRHAEPYFATLYEKDLPRLHEAIALQEVFLRAEARAGLLAKVDDLVRTVVIPAYVRLALRFTERERNDFHALPEHLHVLERLLWCLAGVVVGGVVVWAPFIPLWAKEWVIPFAVAGLFFPNLRRFFALRRYEGEVNRIVAAADRQIGRSELDLLSVDVAASATSSAERTAAPSPASTVPATHPLPDRQKQGGH